MHDCNSSFLSMLATTGAQLLEVREECTPSGSAGARACTGKAILSDHGALAVSPPSAVKRLSPWGRAGEGGEAAAAQVRGVVPLAPHLRSDAFGHRHLQPGPPAGRPQVTPRRPARRSVAEGAIASTATWPAGVHRGVASDVSPAPSVLPISPARQSCPSVLPVSDGGAPCCALSPSVRELLLLCPAAYPQAHGF